MGKKNSKIKHLQTKLGEIAQKTQIMTDKQIPSQTKGFRNQDEDDYRRSAALDRYLNFKPFNRESVKAVVKPGNIKQLYPGGANTCTAAIFFCSIHNFISGQEEMFPDPIAQTRPNAAV